MYRHIYKLFDIVSFAVYSVKEGELLWLLCANWQAAPYLRWVKYTLLLQLCVVRQGS